MEVSGRRLTLRVLFAGAVIAVAAAAGPWAPSAGAAVVEGHVLTGAQPVVAMQEHVALAGSGSASSRPSESTSAHFLMIVSGDTCRRQTP
jgi:hypothetical protein